jgi:peptide/nickel transport system substrate-binding protein
VDGPVRDPVRTEHHRPAQDLTQSRNRLVAAAAALASIVVAAGCGSESAESVAPGAQPSPSGTLGIAAPEPPGTLDPLLATTAADRLVVAQIYEPLTRKVSAPYGQGGNVRGLALWARPGGGEQTWRIRLRQGVRFSDGARLNAAAALANAMRWRTTEEGQALLPGLVAADAPRPDLVRLIFDRPDPDLRRQLASTELGLVSPRALRSPSASTRLARGLAAGTGPFELHRRDAREVLLARNTDWWGTRHELGPGVEILDLRFLAPASRRLALLRRDRVQIAEGLGGDELAALRRDPLLTEQPGPGGSRVGVSRSVRGFSAAQGTPMLSRAWLTTVGAGEGS